jgi:putative heme-binding domain-containing protein
VLDKILDPAAMPADARLKAMAGLTEAATTRKVKPAGDLDAVAKLIQDKAPAIRLAAVKLSAACHVAAALPELQNLALDPRSNADLKQAAIAGLVVLKGDESRQTLLELSEKADSTAIRMQAAAGLTNFDVKLAAEQAAKVLAAASAQDDSGPLLDAFLNRKDGSDELAAALKSAKLPVDVAKRALRTMYAVGRSDAALSSVLSDAAGIAADAPPPTPEEVAKLVAEVAGKGDAARGERIFRRTDLSCMRCHSVSRAGGQVGPELSAVGGSSPLDYIANSILNPNLAVKEQFVTRVFELSDGKVLSGVVIDRDETRIRIRDAQGKILVIPTADIEDETEGKSMMPQGLTKFLTRNELIDLIRFVSELGKPGDYAVQTTPRIQRWQVLANPPAELTAEVPHLDHIRQFVLGSPPESWTSVYGRVSGVLPLDELKKSNGPGVVILRGEFDVKNGGIVAFQIDNTEPYQAWVDAQPAPAQPKFEMGLEPGRHTLTLRIELSNRESPELRVQINHPPGSTARVEIIGGM